MRMIMIIIKMISISNIRSINKTYSKAYYILKSKSILLKINKEKFIFKKPHF